MILQGDDRKGYLKVVSDGTGARNERVYVVPVDGSEPIMLPVSEVEVSLHPDDYVRVRLEVCACEVDLREESRGEITHITGKAEVGSRLTYPRLAVVDGHSQPVLLVGAIWRYFAKDRFGRLYQWGRRV